MGPGGASAARMGRAGAMSAIDVTVPVFGNPTTQSVRDNFSRAKSEIEGLEASKAPRTDLANYLRLAGGTLTGLLTLSGNPTADLHAATKSYVDHVPFLPLAGGTLTGPLMLAADPTTAAGAALRGRQRRGDNECGERALSPARGWRAVRPAVADRRSHGAARRGEQALCGRSNQPSRRHHRGAASWFRLWPQKSRLGAGSADLGRNASGRPELGGSIQSNARTG